MSDAVYCSYKVDSFIGPDKYVAISGQLEDHLILGVQHEEFAFPAIFKKLKPVLPNTRFVARIIN